MKRTGPAWIGLAAWGLWACAAAAAAPTVEADPDRDKVTLGDVIRLVVKAEYPEGWKAELAARSSDLAPFEVLGTKVLAEGRAGDNLRRGFLIRLTIFELGEFQIPPVPVELTDPSGRRSLLYTQPVPLRCLEVSPHPEKDDRIRPIKGPVALGFEAVRTVCLGSAAAVLTMLLAVKVWWRRRSRRRPDPEELKPPHERARLEYGRLQARGLLAQSMAREHFGEWTDILRRYLLRRFALDTFDQTTSQTLALLRARSLAEEPLTQIRELLQEADLAKFARYVPSAETAARLETLFFGFLEATRQAEEPAAPETAPAAEEPA